MKAEGQETVHLSLRFLLSNRRRKTSSFHLEALPKKDSALWASQSHRQSFCVCVCISHHLKKRPLQKTIFPNKNPGQQQFFSQEVQIWKTLIFSPYILKPIFGLISDLFPIAGLHKVDFSNGDSGWRVFLFSFCFIFWLFYFVVWCSLVWLFGLVWFVQRISYTF